MVFKVAHWKSIHWTHYLEGWHFTLTSWHEMLYCWGQCGLRLELKINSDTYLITIYHSRWDNTTRYSVFPRVHCMWQWKTGIHIRTLLTHPVRHTVVSSYWRTLSDTPSCQATDAPCPTHRRVKLLTHPVRHTVVSSYWRTLSDTPSCQATDAPCPTHRRVKLLTHPVRHTVVSSYWRTLSDTPSCQEVMPQCQTSRSSPSWCHLNVNKTRRRIW